MASEMDQFVLSYQVELKDAINRLEQLNSRVDKISAGPGKARKEFAEFSRQAGNEVGRLVPGMDRLGVAVSGVTAGFTGAAAAVGALGVGIMAVIKLRDQFNQQRLVGMNTGISTLRLEDLERKFVTNSNGNVTREQARTNIANVSGFVQRAYTDPERNGPENRMMRMLGMNPGQLGGDMLSTKDALTQLATKFQQMDPANVQGVAQQLGIDKDFAATMAKLGPSISRITELTEEDIAVRQRAEDNLKRLNTDLADLSEQFSQLQIELAGGLLPTLTRFVSNVKDAAKAINDAIPGAKKFVDKHVGQDEKDLAGGLWDYGAPGIAMYKYGFGKVQSLFDGEGSTPGAPESRKRIAQNLDKNFPSMPLLPAIPPTETARAKDYSTDPVRNIPSVLKDLWRQTPWGRAGTMSVEERNADPSKHRIYPFPNAPVKEPRADSILAIAEENTKTVIESGKNADEIVDAADRNNKTGLQTASQMALAVNMFNGAVATFSNAVDERQAWAAWAGEIGRAGGIGTAVESRYPGAGQVEVMPDYAKYSSTNNFDPITRMPGGRGAVIMPTTGGQSNTVYDHLFEEYGRKYGIDPARLKSQAQVESRLNPNAVSGAGAQGLMQLMPETAKALGVINSLDPRQNVEGAAKLMRENLNATKGDWVEALKMYHGGTNRANWGPLTNSYPDKVMRELQVIAGQDGHRIIREEIAPPKSIGKDHLWMRSPIDGVAQPPVADDRQYQMEDAYKVGGESRAKIINAQVQKHLSERLGLPLPQLQHGQVSRDDVAWRMEQLDKMQQNEIYRIKKELGNQMLPDRERARLNEDLREQETGLKSLRRFGPQLLDQADPGPREITIGERAVTINVNGVDAPYETAEAVRDRLNNAIGEIVNDAADGVKY